MKEVEWLLARGASEKGTRWKKVEKKGERERWAAVAEWLEGKDEGKRGGAVEREEGYA